MEQKYIKIERPNNHIVKLILNRPEVHNAFNDNFLAEWTEILASLAKEKDLRVLGISAEGKNFCAGADLNWMRSMKSYSLEENIQDSKNLWNLFVALSEFPAPVVASVQGNVFGGGLGVLACSDIVLTTSISKFCFSEVKLGLIPAVISPFVIKKIGYSSALNLFLSAKLFNAEEALRIHLVHEITNDNESLKAQYETTLKHMSFLGPNATRKAKELAGRVNAELASNQKLSSHESLKEFTCKEISILRKSEEGQEGMSALLDKRKPNF